VYKNNFNGIFIYDILEKIGPNEYESKNGYFNYSYDENYKTISRITIFFTGSEFQIIGDKEPWIYNRKKNVWEFLDYKDYKTY